jgi:hypothetical protein
MLTRACASGAQTFHRLARSGWFPLCALAVVLLIRNPTAWLQPQLWFEDLTVFLREQHELGSAAILQPYAGYLHFYSRFVACGADLLPLLITPWLYTLGALGAWLWMGSRLLRSGLFSSPSWGLAGVLAIGLMPQNGEVILTLTNVQWVLTTGLVVFLISEKYRQPTAEDSVFVFLAGMSGPSGLILSPWVGWRAWQIWRSERRCDVPSVILLGASVVQAGCIMLSSTRAQEASERPVGEVLFRFVHGWSEFLVLPKMNSLWPALWPLGLVALIAGVGYIVCSRLPGAMTRLHWLLAGNAVLLAGIVSSWEEAPRVQGNGSRYFFVACALFCLTLFQAWERAPRRRAWQIIPVAVVLSLLASTSRLPFVWHGATPENWAQVCREFAAGKTVFISVPRTGYAPVELRPDAKER